MRCRSLCLLVTAGVLAGCAQPLPVPPAPVAVRPGLARFLGAHQELGRAVGVEWMPDWAGGPRERLRTTAGVYRVYFRDDEVITVYREPAVGDPVEVWRADGY